MRGPEHPHVVSTLRFLADCTRKQHHYAEAEEFARRALDIARRTAPQTEDEAHCALVLAKVYALTDRSPDALALCRSAVELRKALRGAAHPDTVDAMHTLALLCLGAGEPAEAERLYRQVVAVMEEAGEPEHPDLARILNTLSTLCFHQGRREEAASLSGRGLAIAEARAGGDSPYLLDCLENYAACCVALGRLPEAEAACRRVQATLVEALGPQHARVAACFQVYAQLSFQRNLSAGAIEDTGTSALPGSEPSVPPPRTQPSA
jgi:tetratricopeptide (TPR) repeat protein